MAAVEQGVVGSALEAAGPAEVEPVEDAVRDLTDEERQAFVDYVRGHQGCSVQEACKQVGVRRKDVRALRKADSEFDEDYRVARGYGTEQILGGMVKLGIEGVEEPLVSAGKLVRGDDGEIITVRRYDSRALIAMFNGMTPDGKALAAGKLGIEISGPDGGPIKVQAGVPLADVARVLLEAGVDLSALAGRPALGEIEGEIVGEEDGGPA